MRHAGHLHIEVDCRHDASAEFLLDQGFDRRAINANDFVEKLRQKRSEAKETPIGKSLPHTYSREDILTAVEKGKNKVTLPTRDPKLARKNRKLYSAKLVESSRSASNGRGSERTDATMTAAATLMGARPPPHPLCPPQIPDLSSTRKILGPALHPF